MLTNKMQVEYLPVSELKDYPRQFRKPSDKQLGKTARMIEEYGLPVPVVVDEDNCIVIGLNFAAALRHLKWDETPVIRITHLDKEQIRLLRIVYDRLAEESTWDRGALADEFRELELILPDLDFTTTGFETGEIDLILDFSPDSDPDNDPPEPETDRPAVTKPGDLWGLGKHRLYCGSSLESDSFSILMGDDKAHMIFTDPPFNVRIDGHVCGNGRIKHREFAMGCGEMSEDEFIKFMVTFIKLAIQYSRDGSLHYICMDWRHIFELLSAGRGSYSELKNICVWVKNNGGLGSFYRSRHELVAVFKNGKKPHVNNIELGKHGRYRTNIWEYAGVNSFSRHADLEMHPTAKPVSMVADAIKDCTKRRHIVLDPFSGSGTTLIACEKSGRQARCIEIDPHYCDVIIRRWQAMTGQDAIHAETFTPFDKQEDHHE